MSAIQRIALATPIDESPNSFNNILVASLLVERIKTRSQLAPRFEQPEFSVHRFGGLLALACASSRHRYLLERNAELTHQGRNVKVQSFTENFTILDREDNDQRQ